MKRWSLGMFALIGLVLFFVFLGHRPDGLEEDPGVPSVAEESAAAPIALGDSEPDAHSVDITTAARPDRATEDEMAAAAALSTALDFYRQGWVDAIDDISDEDRERGRRVEARTVAEHVIAVAQGDLWSAEWLRSRLIRCDEVPVSQHELDVMNIFDGNADRAAPAVYGLDFRPSIQQELAEQSTPEIEALRESLTQHLAECAPLHQLRNAGYRSDLRTLADSGNAAAAYLYATWKPMGLDGPWFFGDQLAWQNRAATYAHRSLVSGRPAGYLAFLRSYDDGLFTERNDISRLAFLLAYTGCGFSSALAVTDRVHLYGYFGGVLRPDKRRTLDEAEAEAAGLMEYCVAQP